MGKKFGILVVVAAVALTGVWLAQRPRAVVQRDFAVAQAMLKAKRFDVAFPLISAHRGDPSWRGLELLLLDRLGFDVEGIEGTDHLWLLFDADHLVDEGDVAQARELLGSSEYGDGRDVARLLRLALLTENREEGRRYLEQAHRCDPQNRELCYQ